MASKGQGSGQLAERYAVALLDLADEAKVLDQVDSDLGKLCDMLGESADLVRLVRSPVLGREAQGKAITAIAEKAGLHTLVCNTLALMARNRRLMVLDAMIDAFRDELARRRGDVTAEVISATPLDEARVNKLTDTLKGALGARVNVNLTVDPAIIGGLVVRIGSRLVDASLANRLQRLQFAMKGQG